MQKLFSQKVSILPKTLIVIGQAGIETHCRTAGDHLLSPATLNSVRREREPKQNSSKRERESREMLGTSEETHHLVKASIFFWIWVCHHLQLSL